MDRVARACGSEEFYQALRPAGPFDGGCLVTALALQRVLGGYLWGLFLPDRDAVQHCVLNVRGLLADAGGLRTPDGMLNFHRRAEAQSYGLAGPLSIEDAASSCAYDNFFDLGSGSIVVEALTTIIRDHLGREAKIYSLHPKP